MLLVYPLVILGLTLWTNTIQHFETIAYGSIMGLPGYFIFRLVFYLGVSFILAVVVGFIQFIRAYAADDLCGRVKACSLVSMFPIVPLSIAWLLLPWSPIVKLAEMSGWSFLGFLFLVSIWLSALFLAIALSERLERRLISWFERNAPLTSASARGPRIKGMKRGHKLSFIAPEWKDAITQTEDNFLSLSKILWCASCFFYGVMVAATIWNIGMGGIVTYHVVILIAFLIATVVVISRRVRARVGSILKK